MLIDTQLIIYGNITDIFSGKRSFIKLETLEYGIVKINIRKKLLIIYRKKLKNFVGISVTGRKNTKTQKLSNICFIFLVSDSDKYGISIVEKLLRFK